MKKEIKIIDEIINHIRYMFFKCIEDYEYVDKRMVLSYLKTKKNNLKYKK